MHLLKFSIKETLPLAITVIPFGLVKGSMAAKSGLPVLDLMTMSLSIFAGASQIAVLQMLNEGAHAAMIIISGAMINLRMILYSLYFSQQFNQVSLIKKMVYSYLITDQSYAIFQKNEKIFSNHDNRLKFFFYAGFIFCLSWQISVYFGYYFGNSFTHISDMDFMVPLVFIGILGPHLKKRIPIFTALISAVLSIILTPLPLNIGFILAILTSVFFAVQLTKVSMHIQGKKI